VCAHPGLLCVQALLAAAPREEDRVRNRRIAVRAVLPA